MKNITKRLICLVFALAVCLMPAAALTLEAGTGDNIYVTDNANVLSSTTEDYIAELNGALEENCSGAQFAVVTVSYLDEDTQIASLQLMNDWGVGSAEQNNGMLLLLVANENRGWLSVGDGLDEHFDDDTVDEYLNEYFWDYVDAGDPDTAVTTLAAAIADWYADYYDTDLTLTAADADSAAYGAEDAYLYEDPIPETESRGGVGFSSIVMILILLVLWSLISRYRYRRMRGWGYSGSFWPILLGTGLYHSWNYHRAPPPPGAYGGPRNYGHGGRPGGPGGPGGFGGGGFGGGHGGFGGGSFGGGHGGGGGGGRH